MANFTYQVGDVTKVKFNVPVFIPHVCNDENLMGSGLAGAIARKWPEVKKMYHRWFKEMSEPETAEPFKLGRIQSILLPDNVVVVNMLAQSDCGGYKTIDGNVLPPMRHESLKECLYRLKEDLKDAKNIYGFDGFAVSTGLIGSGLAGGDWYEITQQTYKIFRDMDFEWNWYGLSESEVEEAKSKDYKLLSDQLHQEALEN